jgi:hypothetical protein
MKDIMPSRRQLIQQSLAGALLGAGLTVTAAHAAGPAWPRQPLRIVIPFAAGGTSDVIARLIAKPLSDALGQPVVIENRTGGSGNLAAEVMTMSPAETTQFVVKDRERWSNVIQRAGKDIEGTL